jgi:hypothetical protein
MGIQASLAVKSFETSNHVYSMVIKLGVLSPYQGPALGHHPVDLPRQEKVIVVGSAQHAFQVVPSQQQSHHDAYTPAPQILVGQLRNPKYSLWHI